MTHRRLLPAAALVAALVLPAQAQSPSPAPAAPGTGQPAEASARAKAPLIVGVVDIDKAVDLYPKAIAERERLKQLSNSLADRLDAVQKEIDQIRADIGTYKEGSDKREWLQQYELPERQKRKEALRQLARMQMDRETAKFNLMMYEDVEVAVREVAKARGVQIVLRSSSVPGVEELPKSDDLVLNARLRAYDQRQVWFASEEVDLTPAVIKLLQVPVESPKDASGKAGAGKPGDGKPGGDKPVAPDTAGAKKPGGGL